MTASLLRILCRLSHFGALLCSDVSHVAVVLPDRTQRQEWNDAVLIVPDGGVVCVTDAYIVSWFEKGRSCSGCDLKRGSCSAFLIPGGSDSRAIGWIPGASVFSESIVLGGVYEVCSGEVRVMQSTVGLMWSNLTKAVLPTRRLVTMATMGNSQSKRPLKGVVFDMDGTLTVPCIDFRLMYRKVLGDDHPSVVNNSPVDILHEISGWSSEKQVQAYAIITEIEKDAHEKLQVMPGAKEVCTFLDSHHIPRGLITRNVKDSVDFFHSQFGLSKFSPALSREFTPCKPSPAPLLHICDIWGISPSEVMMVGDSAPDDVVCGNRAGALTCLLDEEERYHINELPEEQRPTHKIHSLLELNSVLESYNLQLVDAALPSQRQD
ncbi:hypothetical protein M758_UG074800 [Ceratodon purpureus]|nr:hypothetical protein M758_UG074800 [Ceratodon purpureus]